jgi:hypothetical protein
MTWTRKLVALDACSDAVEWAGTQPDLLTAWTACECADWMLWLLARLHKDRKPVVWLACQCARTTLKYVPKNEKRLQIAIETTERWCQGKATIEDVRTAAYAAYAASASASAYAYANAASAASAYAYAAAAAATAAYAAAAAATAASAAAAYAYAADAAVTTAADACLKSHKAMAQMIRRSVPDPNDVSGVKFTKARRANGPGPT